MKKKDILAIPVTWSALLKQQLEGSGIWKCYVDKSVSKKYTKKELFKIKKQIKSAEAREKRRRSKKITMTDGDIQRRLQ